TRWPTLFVRTLDRDQTPRTSRALARLGLYRRRESAAVLYGRGPLIPDAPGVAGSAHFQGVAAFANGSCPAGMGSRVGRLDRRGPAGNRRIGLSSYHLQPGPAVAGHERGQDPDEPCGR